MPVTANLNWLEVVTKKRLCTILTPIMWGGIDWQNYEVRGDTLYAKGFKKVIVKGKDVTKDFHTVEEKRIRVNANDNMNDFDIIGYLNHIIEE